VFPPDHCVLQSSPCAALLYAPRKGRDETCCPEKRRRVSGPIISGLAANSHGLRVHRVSWPPLRSTRLSFELEEVAAIRLIARRVRAGTVHAMRGGAQMTRYIGSDVHKRFVANRILDAQRKKFARGQVSCVRMALQAFANTFLQWTDHLVLEASTNTWSVVAILKPHIARLVVGNPHRTNAIAEAMIMTDKVDAEGVAQLLRCDYPSSLSQRDPDTEQLRCSTTQHSTLMTE
jgi:hypothetical protein